MSRVGEIDFGLHETGLARRIDEVLIPSERRAYVLAGIALTENSGLAGMEVLEICADPVRAEAHEPPISADLQEAATALLDSSKHGNRFSDPARHLLHIVRDHGSREQFTQQAHSSEPHSTASMMGTGIG